MALSVLSDPRPRVRVCPRWHCSGCARGAAEGGKGVTVVGCRCREGLAGGGPLLPHGSPQDTHTCTHAAGAPVLTFSFLALPLPPLLPLTPLSLCLMKSIQASLGSMPCVPSAGGSWNTASRQAGLPPAVGAAPALSRQDTFRDVPVRRTGLPHPRGLVLVNTGVLKASAAPSPSFPPSRRREGDQAALQPGLRGEEGLGRGWGAGGVEHRAGENPGLAGPPLPASLHRSSLGARQLKSAREEATVPPGPPVRPPLEWTWVTAADSTRTGRLGGPAA